MSQGGSSSFVHDDNCESMRVTNPPGTPCSCPPADTDCSYCGLSFSHPSHDKWCKGKPLVLQEGVYWIGQQPVSYLPYTSQYDRPPVNVSKAPEERPEVVRKVGRRFR